MQPEDAGQVGRGDRSAGYTGPVSAPNAHSVPPTRAAAGAAPLERRTTALILAVVSAIAIGCAFGPQWAQFLGLGLVILALVWSTLASWREIDRLTAEHTAALRAMRQQAKAAAHAHHLEQMAMIERFSARATAQRARLGELTATLSALQDELADEREQLANATAELTTGRERIASLEKLVSQVSAQLESAEAELEELQALTPDAEVLHMPRRVSEGDTERAGQLRQA